PLAADTPDLAFGRARAGAAAGRGRDRRRDQHRAAHRRPGGGAGAGAARGPHRRRGRAVGCRADGQRRGHPPRRRQPRRRGRRRRRAARDRRGRGDAVRRARQRHGREGGQQRRRPRGHGGARRGDGDGPRRRAGPGRDHADARAPRRRAHPPADPPRRRARRAGRLRRRDAAGRGAQGLDARPGHGAAQRGAAVRHPGGADRVRHRGGCRARPRRLLGDRRAVGGVDRPGAAVRRGGAVVTARGVHALRYAYRTESVKGEHFYGHPEDCTAPWPIHYFTWVVVDEDAVTVVDAGFTREEAQRRGARTYLGSPVELLGELGVDPADVDHLVLTHLHYDHTGHLGDYPNARLWVQRRELDFWNGPFAHRGANAHLRPHEDLER